MFVQEHGCRLGKVIRHNRNDNISYTTDCFYIYDNNSS